MGRRWLHSVDLETDADNRPLAEQALIALGEAIADGRVKVDASGITLEADVVDVDMEALTGDPGKTLADLYTALGLVAKESGGNLAAIKAKTDNIPADPAKESGKLTDIAGHAAEVVKDHKANQRTPYFAGKVCAVGNVIEDLVSGSTPYVRAWLQAYTPAVASSSSSSSSSSSEGACGLPGSNTGNVYILKTGGDGTLSWVLTPGASVELPPCCDLSDFDIVAATGGDGVIILYET